MKCPKYIDKLIDRRARLARELLMTDYTLSEWIDKNGIEVEPEDYFGGCEVYCNPDDCAERIRQAIAKAGDKE